VTLGAAIFWVAAGWLAGAAAASANRSLRDATRLEIEEACRRRRAEHLAREMVVGQRSVLSATELLQIVCNCIPVASLAFFVANQPSTADWNVVAQLALVVVIGGLALAISTVWIPSAVARVWGISYVAASWPLWRAVSRLLMPLVAGLRQTDRLAQALMDRSPALPAEPAADGESRGGISEEGREAQLDEDAREMIESVMQLHEAEVAQVMTPRTYMFSMRASVALEEAVKLVISSGHTRMPVYDKNRDDIVGILHMKDLLPELMKSPQDRAPNIKELLRPAHFVPETKRLDELLEEFQETRNHMAIVLDEFGGVSGLVTIEDVLEEIVGEIVDEYDEALVEEIKSIDDRTAEVAARVRIDEINERLGTHLAEEGEFDTIGGFVFSHLGHIPTVGESVTVDDVRLTAIDATRRRIERVRIEVLDPTRA
jgi:CBS domain containing-hemolysin-like protein